MNEPTNPLLWNNIVNALPLAPEEYEIEVAKQLEQLFLEFDIEKGSKLLEIAGGTGYISAHLASKGYKTTVTDFSDDMLKRAKEYYEKNNLPGDFLILDMFKLSKERVGSHDVVWIMRVFDHYDGWEVLQVLENMVKVANKLVVIIYQNTKCDPYQLYHKTSVEKGKWEFGLSILRDDLTDLATLAGLDVIDVRLSTSFSELKNYVHLCEHLDGKLSDVDKKKLLSKDQPPLKLLIGRPSSKELDSKDKATLLKKILKNELEYLRKTYHFDINAFEKRVEGLEEQIKSSNIQHQNTVPTTHETNHIIQEIQELKKKITLEQESEIINHKSKIEESEISQYKSKLAEKESEISNLQNAIANYQNMITDIHQSFILRMLHKYDKTLGKIIPLKPKKYVKSIKKQSTAEEHLINTQKAIENTKLEKKDILCFPIINWDYRYQRPQHIMTEFAKIGHRVFYFTTNLRQLNNPYEIKQIKENVFQVELNSPTFFDIYKDTFDKSTLEKIMSSIESFQQEMNLDAISFVEFPTWTTLVLELKKKFNYGIIFDCLDDFTGFGNVIKEREKEEKILLKNSDLVIASASHLLKKTMRETNKALFLPNAGEFEHFNKNQMDKPLKDYKKPIIGYFGSIADWFDNEILEFVAENRPDLTFVFIGHTFGSDIRKLRELTNVHFLGERPYSELPKFLHEFDVCLIPFKVTPLIVATHPVKIYEYLSAGKPVVTTDIPELLPMANLCYIAKNREDFLKKIDLALTENNKNLVQNRIDFASKNTWQQRFLDLYLEIKKISSLNVLHHK